jgi:tripartite-type tricarboxylate transporter receptor subunit TctC
MPNQRPPLVDLCRLAAGTSRLRHRAAEGALFALALLVAAPQAQAQTFPSQPIRLIVPFAPGGGVDVIGRLIGDQMARQSGHTVVVENKTGAGGNVASAFVARSAPDGYTLLVASNSNAYNDFLYSDIGYDPAKELLRVAQFGRVPMVLLVSPSVAPRTVQEVIALAKAKPDTLTFGSGGNGTAEHLVYELFKRKVGIEVAHVAYRGGAQAYTDLIGGQIQFMFNNQLGAMPFIKGGKLRAVGLAGQERSRQLPDLPTFAEQGIPDFDAAVWWGLMAPAGTPAKVVNELNRMVNEALKAPEVASRLEALGAQPAGGSPAQFESFFAAERSTWRQVIKDAGIRLN